jgi:MATE family multidrug resistance protein
LRELVGLGLPVGMTNLGEMGAFVASTFLVGLFGSDAVAAHAIALECAGLAFMIPWGLAQAATVKVGRALGAGDPGAARRAGWCALALGTAFGCCSALALWLGGPLIAGLFLDQTLAANRIAFELATAYLAVVAAFQLADGPEVIAAGVLRGHRDTEWPMRVVLAGYWGLCPPLAVVLAFGASLDGLGIWIALACSMTVVSAVLVRRVLRQTATALTPD